MNLAEAAKKIEPALTSPVETWPGYSPKSLPLAIYDARDVIFYNHPDPPQERPEQLAAATAVKINGVVTATIPVEMCPSETELIPLVYHEGFHVYQDRGAFQFSEQFNFFKALAFYPELNGTYRGLCLAEAEVINDSLLSSKEKAIYLATLAQRRHKILTEQEGLLAFEKSSERREGTASYVEQQARTQIFSMPVEAVPTQYGWSRQYTIGAGTCYLLDELVKGWPARVEAGESPTGVLIRGFGQEKADLTRLKLAEKIAQENEATAQIRANLQAKIDRLEAEGAIRLRLPTRVSIRRSFNPQAIVSLGDGRLLHSDYLLLQLPNGKISLRGDGIVEDYSHNEVIFPPVPLQIVNDRLAVDTQAVQIFLTGVQRVGENMFKLDPVG
jgi:hypothetical protein